MEEMSFREGEAMKDHFTLELSKTTMKLIYLVSGLGILMSLVWYILMLQFQFHDLFNGLLHDIFIQGTIVILGMLAVFFLSKFYDMIGDEK